MQICTFCKIWDFLTFKAGVWWEWGCASDGRSHGDEGRGVRALGLVDYPGSHLAHMRSLKLKQSEGTRLWADTSCMLRNAESQSFWSVLTRFFSKNSSAIPAQTCLWSFMTKALLLRNLRRPPAKQSSAIHVPVWILGQNNPKAPFIVLRAKDCFVSCILIQPPLFWDRPSKVQQDGFITSGLWWNAALICCGSLPAEFLLFCVVPSTNC